jgi:hypothetical protein
VLPTLVRLARRTLERGRRSPQKGDGRLSRARPGRRRDVGPVRHVSSVTISPVRPSPLPRRHPGHCSTIPTLWEYGTTRRRHVCCCAPYGLPSAAPSSQCADRDQTGNPHTATLEAAPGREQDSPRHPAGTRFARTAINSTTLCTIPLHVIRTVQRNCKLPPLSL